MSGQQQKYVTIAQVFNAKSILCSWKWNVFEEKKRRISITLLDRWAASLVPSQCAFQWAKQKWIIVNVWICNENSAFEWAIKCFRCRCNQLPCRFLHHTLQFAHFSQTPWNQTQYVHYKHTQKLAHPLSIFSEYTIKWYHTLRLWMLLLFCGRFSKHTTDYSNEIRISFFFTIFLRLQMFCSRYSFPVFFFLFLFLFSASLLNSFDFSTFLLRYYV